MVVKVYVSGISGNKEVKKRQQKVLLILDSKKINYEVLDIAEPNMEEAKEYMQNNSKMNGATISDPTPRHPLPPQLYNDEEYCGDYDAFDMANEIDEMEKFLKLAEDEIPISNAEIKIGNGEVPIETKSKEATPEKNSAVQENGKDEDNEPKNNEADEEKSRVKSPSPQKEKSRSPSKEKSLEPEKKEKSPSSQKEKSPSPQKEKSPSPQKEKSPSPQKEKSPSPAKDEEKGAGDNETDDQKAENVIKEDNAETAKDTEETEKSDEE